MISFHYQAGQLDEKEFLYLKRQVDKNIIKLNNYSPPWVKTNQIKKKKNLINKNKSKK